VSRFRQNAGRQMAKQLDPEILSRMVCMASIFTKGRSLCASIGMTPPTTLVP
jgi:hypothetical protein